MITQRGLMSPRSNNQIRTESGIRPGHSHIYRSMSQHVSRPGPIRRPEGPPRTTPTRPPAPDPPPTTQRIRTSHRPTELGAELRAATRRPLMASLDSHGRALRRIATRRRHRPTARRTSRTTCHRATGCRSLGSGAAESSEAESSELAFEDGWAGRPDDRRRLPRSHAPVLAPRRALRRSPPQHDQAADAVDADLRDPNGGTSAQPRDGGYEHLPERGRRALSRAAFVSLAGRWRSPHSCASLTASPGCSDPRTTGV